MDEHSTGALQYGHLGRALYDSETRTWGFSRTLEPAPSIAYAGVSKTTVPSPLAPSQSSSVENKNSLPKLYPELAACWPLVGNETLSHLITTASEICDPLVSSLFDLGYAVNLENDDSGSRVVPIAVVASGECGNAISLYKIEEESVELRQDTTSRARVPSIRETECAEWSVGSAPVRQICFARTVEERATWMAVRFPHSTTVFRPEYHRNPISVHVNRSGDRMLPANPRTSRLDANPLVEVSILQTGGFSHADVTFNPWYQKQLAIVDERGNWSVWEISGRHRRNKANWAVTCVKSGSLPWLDLGDSYEIDDHPRHDGWATIEWAGDVNSFVVSDRRCPMLYRMESDRVYPFSIELGLKRKSEWILDVKRSTYDVSHLFILTTSRVFWVDIAPDPALVNEGDARPSLYPRLSWRHFRDPEDTSLQLAPLLVQEDFYLVLYSRLNHLALAFHCPNNIEGDADGTSVPDPFVLDIPPVSDYSSQSRSPRNATQLSSLSFREITHLPLSVGKKDHDPSARFIKLFMVDSRLSVRELIYAGPRGDGATDEQVLGRDVLRLRRRYHGAQVAPSTRSLDDFVVDDWDEYVLEMGTPMVPKTKISAITPLVIPPWSVDYAQVYAVASGKLMVLSRKDEALQNPDKGFKESIEELGNRISGAELSSENISRTLLESLGSKPSLDDIDQNAHDFERLLSMLASTELSPEIQNPYMFVFQPPSFFDLPSIKPAGSGETSSTANLIEVYDCLVNDWLSNLPHDIPGRTRILKEKVIRSVAVDLVLAQITTTRTSDHGSEPRNQRSDTVPVGLNNSADASLSFNKGYLSSSAISGGTNSEIPDSSATVRTGQVTGQLGAPGSMDIPESPYAGLSSLTTFKGDRSMPRNVSSMLHHWQPGVDPATYDWQRTIQIQEAAEESLRVPKATTPKRRLRKKMSQGASLDSSAPPPVSSAAPSIREWGSQPENNEPPVIRLRSSQVVEDDLPMTQVERGAFGGREASRKIPTKVRKKKRAAGF